MLDIEDCTLHLAHETYTEIIFFPLSSAPPQNVKN